LVVASTWPRRSNWRSGEPCASHAPRTNGELAAWRPSQACWCCGHVQFHIHTHTHPLLHFASLPPSPCSEAEAEALREAAKREKKRSRKGVGAFVDD
jgi:hypothetical protein